MSESTLIVSHERLESLEIGPVVPMTCFPCPCPPPPPPHPPAPLHTLIVLEEQR